MEFALVCIGMIVVVGVIALNTITVAHDCATCSAAQEGDCKIHCLLEEKKKKEVEQGGSCTGDGT